MYWIIGAFALTWAAIGALAWYGRREIIARDASIREAMYRNAADTIDIINHANASLGESIMDLKKFSVTTDQIATGASSRTDRNEGEIHALRALLVASLDTYHGDRKGDKLKPWRNLPQFKDLAGH